MTPASGHNPRGLLDPVHLDDPASVRPPGGAVLDLHAHSSDRSRDSGVRAHAIAAQAVRRGLDGVVLTEHNAIWHPDDLRELSERAEVQMLPGMEIGTNVGYRTISYHDRSRMDAAEFLRFHRYLRDTYPGVHATLRVETINGDHADTDGGPFEQLAARIGVGAIGGSDIHSEQAVGRAVTTFESTVESIDDLVDQLRARLTRARDLRPRRKQAAD